VFTGQTFVHRFATASVGATEPSVLRPRSRARRDQATPRDRRTRA